MLLGNRLLGLGIGAGARGFSSYLDWGFEGKDSAPPSFSPLASRDGSAMQRNSDGEWEYAPENLAHPSDLTQASLARLTASISDLPRVISTDDVYDVFQDEIGTERIQVQHDVIEGTPVTYSIYFRCTDYPILSIGFNDRVGFGASQTFRPDGTPSGTDASMWDSFPAVDEGNGWIRVSSVLTPTATGFQTTWIQFANANVGEVYQLSGLSVQTGNKYHKHIYTTSEEIFEPRTNHHHPHTLKDWGFLAEMSNATNLNINSENFTATGSASIVSDKTESDPLGGNSGSIISGADGTWGGNYAAFGGVMTVTPSDTVVASVFIKSADVSGATTADVIIRDNSTGLLPSTTIDLTSEWQRVEVTTQVGGTTTSIRALIGNTDGDIVVAHGQVELGTTASSPIITTGAAATRLADNVDLKVFSTAISEFTIFVDYTELDRGPGDDAITSFYHPVDRRWGTAYLRDRPTDEMRCRLIADPTETIFSLEQYNDFIESSPVGVRRKAALRVKQDDCGCASNGVIGLADDGSSDVVGMTRFGLLNVATEAGGGSLLPIGSYVIHRVSLLQPKTDSQLVKLTDLAQGNLSLHTVFDWRPDGPDFDPVFGSLTHERAGSATEVNSSGVIQTVGVDVPRHPHYRADDLTRSSYLNEGQSTNLNWYHKGTTGFGALSPPDGSTWSAGVGVAPNGLVELDEIKDLSTIYRFGMQLNTSTVDAITPNETYVASIFIDKADSALSIFPRYQLRYTGGSLQDAIVVFDSYTGTIGANSFADAYVEEYPTSWRLCIPMTDAGSNNLASMFLWPTYYTANDATAPSDVTATGSIRFWGRQLEPGTRATSIIETNGASATRLPDSLVGRAIADSKTYSAIFKCRASNESQPIGLDSAIFEWNDGTDNNSIRVYARSSSSYSPTLFMTAGGVTSIFNTAGSAIDFEDMIVGFSVTEDKALLVINGQTLVDQAPSAGVPDKLTQINFFDSLRSSIDAAMVGEAEQCQAYNRALSETELQNLTTS